MSAPPRSGGLIAWMVDNRVTPNLLMIFLLVGGFFMATRIKQEVFPEFDLDLIQVSVAYPGASPEEVERGIVLAIEEAVRGLDGIEEIQATAGEGVGQVTLQLLADADVMKVYQDVRQAVDQIRTFPGDTEQPRVTQVARRREVLDLQVFGDVEERVLREAVEQVRDRLLQHDGITQVDVLGVRGFEVHVEIPQERLRALGLTLPQVARTIGDSSVELPGGGVKTRGGEILLRVSDRRDWAREFATIPVLTTDNGTVVRLGEIAHVSEGFEDVDRYATYDGKRSINLEVYRVGDQTPIGVSEAAREVMAEAAADLPGGIDWAINRDRSDIYRQRLQLLLKNAFLGLSLVLLLLGLFLELRVAFWVTMGIPTSFLGAMLFLPSMGVSINMISMFAFIVALGIVVDDAIIAGENIYEHRENGMSFRDAAVEGAREVAVPVTFSIATNMVTFLPLAFVPGFFGKIWAVIPLVVITVFAISWVESLIILPAHLGHGRDRRGSAARSGPVYTFQRACARGIEAFVRRVYGPVLDLCLRWRWVTLAAGVATLILTYGYVFGGRIGLILMPRVESDHANVTAVLPHGASADNVRRVADRVVAGMAAVAAEYADGTENLLLVGTFAEVEDNRVNVRAYMREPGVRPLTTREVSGRWRDAVGPVVGLESLRFESDRGGPGSGASLTVELSHRDIGVLERASAALAERLGEFPNVKDIDDGYSDGKQQLDFELLPEGAALGLTSAAVARQVRAAYYGAEALRQQRERNEIKVLVRRPEAERRSEYDIETLLIQTPIGRQVPLREVARVERGRSYTAISRRDARRTVQVTANVEPIGETRQVMATLNESVLAQLVEDFPGLTFGYEGRQASMKDSIGALLQGFLLALVVIYFLLAIPFRSYSQPLAVMLAIPFGMVGAVCGHVIMGYDLSVLSLMGIVALSGVVVNDSLVLVDYANGRRKAGVSALEAIREAGSRRFRPVLLTTLTTFGGLAPMIFETSRQARFMIPMAISLGFGIVFATVVTLILVPSLYGIIDDLRRVALRARDALSGPRGGRSSDEEVAA